MVARYTSNLTDTRQNIMQLCCVCFSATANVKWFVTQIKIVVSGFVNKTYFNVFGVNLIKYFNTSTKIM